MSVAKKTEMCFCMYVCGPSEASSLQHTYTHMHISVFFLIQGCFTRGASQKPFARRGFTRRAFAKPLGASWKPFPRGAVTRERLAKALVKPLVCHIHTFQSFPTDMGVLHCRVFH